MTRGMGTAARKLVHASESAEANTIHLPDGTRAERVGSALEVRDRSGGLLIRYVDGHAEVHAPRGDLTFSAPGSVVLQAGADVRIDAHRRFELSASEGHLEVSRVQLVADQVATAIAAAAHRVEHYELEAERITQRARDVFHDVRGLMQSRLQRARTLVRESHTLHAERTVIVSERETTIDGERILIG